MVTGSRAMFCYQRLQYIHLTSSGYVQFWSALYAHFSHLQQMGKHGVAVSMPSLATVG